MSAVYEWKHRVGEEEVGAIGSFSSFFQLPDAPRADMTCVGGGVVGVMAVNVLDDYLFPGLPVDGS